MEGLQGLASLHIPPLDVAASRDQERVVWGEVQVGHPAAVERIHAVFTVPRTDLEQRAVFDAPQPDLSIVVSSREASAVPGESAASDTVLVAPQCVDTLPGLTVPQLSSFVSRGGGEEATLW